MSNTPTRSATPCHYYIDLSAARAPARLVDRAQSPAPNPRFYGPGKAGAQAEKLLELVESRGAVPPDLGLPIDFTADAVKDVLRHLVRQWAALPPARGGERQQTGARLHLVHGFDAVLRATSGLGRGAAMAAQTETWTVRDVSDGGFGAILPQTPADWLRVGTLIATRLESTVSWGVAVISRLRTTPQQQRLVGIKLLSSGATPVQLLPVDGDGDELGEVGLLLPSSKVDSAGKDEVQLLLRAGSFYSHRAVHMVMHQRVYPLMPKQMVEAGRDFELWRFRVGNR
ncbi:MAG: hypothetical protein FJY37_07435 [Betaproteobacteria bacterium]|nr:hypothetical protein [Betaproteobacteria bacterium]